MVFYNKQALATDIIPGLPTFQQPIMSMEEDDVSDQEIVSYP